MALRIGGGGSNTGGASTLHIISHDSFREHTLLADTTNGDEQDHSVGGGADVRLPPPPQSKAYSSSISRRVLNCLVKKENQIKKTKSSPETSGKELRASPLDSKRKSTGTYLTLRMLLRVTHLLRHDVSSGERCSDCLRHVPRIHSKRSIHISLQKRKDSVLSDGQLIFRSIDTYL